MPHSIHCSNLKEIFENSYFNFAYDDFIEVNYLSQEYVFTIWIQYWVFLSQKIFSQVKRFLTKKNEIDHLLCYVFQGINDSNVKSNFNKLYDLHNCSYDFPDEASIQWFYLDKMKVPIEPVQKSTSIFFSTQGYRISSLMILNSAQIDNQIQPRIAKHDYDYVDTIFAGTCKS